MIIPAIVIIGSVLAVPVLALMSNRRYNSKRQFRERVISEEGVRRMRLEHWYQSITPVVVVQYFDDPPPERPHE
jgi:hypothetical protein